MTYSDDFDGRDLDRDEGDDLDLDDLRDAALDPRATGSSRSSRGSSRPARRPGAERSVGERRSPQYSEPPRSSGPRGSGRYAQGSYARETYVETPGYGGGYSSGYGGGNRGGDGGYTTSGMGASGMNRSAGWGNWTASLTVIAIVAVVAFFVGFASRNAYDDAGGFDDERIVAAEQIPVEFREFCFSYNGYPSFTLVETVTLSTLTASAVPIVRLNTCTVPVDQTANALQALGIRRRADTIGPQLGGSNLTLVSLPFAASIAAEITRQFPEIAQVRGGGEAVEEEVIADLERAINTVLDNDAIGYNLQNLTATNISGVYVLIPGHSFNLKN